MPLSSPSSSDKTSRPVVLKPPTSKCFEWLSKEGTFKDKTVLMADDFEHEKFQVYDLNCMMNFMKDIFDDDDEAEIDAAHTSLSPELKLHQCCRALANCFDVPPNKRNENAIRSLWHLLLRATHAEYVVFEPQEMFSPDC